MNCKFPKPDPWSVKFGDEHWSWPTFWPQPYLPTLSLSGLTATGLSRQMQVSYHLDADQAPPTSTDSLLGYLEWCTDSIMASCLRAVLLMMLIMFVLVLCTLTMLFFDRWSHCEKDYFYAFLRSCFLGVKVSNMILFRCSQITFMAHFLMNGQKMSPSGPTISFSITYEILSIMR